ncbi:DNA cytosine methyltransferase, partial [Bacillus pumilus]
MFCGAGGLSLGFNQKGFHVILAHYIEKSALRTDSL